MKVSRPRAKTRARLFLGIAALMLAATAMVAQPAHAATGGAYQIWDYDWGNLGRQCLYSENGAYSTLGMSDKSPYNDPCNDDRSVWVFIRVDTTSGGTPLYNIRHGNDDKCVGVKGVESGDTHIGQRLQLEGCENRDDGRWYIKNRSDGTYIHNYSPKHRDLVMQWAFPTIVELGEYPRNPTGVWDMKEL